MGLTKADIEEIVLKLKRYVDELMSGYGRTEKELSEFESRHMQHYADNMPLKQNVFRLFLRSFVENQNVEEITKEDIDNLNWD